MNKFLSIAVALMALVSFSAQAANDKPIEINQLPQKAQTFIQSYFPSETVAFAKVDRDIAETTYEVIFTSGSKVDFNKNGEWTEVDCKYTQLPISIVPKQILDEVAKKYPNTTINKIEKNRRNFEVTLSNKTELKFNSKFQIIDIDID